MAFHLFSQSKAQPSLEMPEMETAELENTLEEENVEGASSSTQEVQQLLKQKHEDMQKIFSNVKQNFGKINVAPEFSEEDLVPVEMPDISDSLEDEKDEENEEDEEQVEKNDEEEQEESSVVGQPTKSTQEVNKELDEKISKLKQFLDRAKSKRFSALRFV